MGEVYRADDLKLGQPVALKFLPRDLAKDAVRRERLMGEVRIARQVSHPNLCRVYVIGEIEGRHFLTMEYIDGEDLASLLKRIGHLHGRKALDVARQLCAGLAAAHDRGVLHRDLKPANVMIDGRGRVRITDFGIALAAGEAAETDVAAGTPAYMAPEQLAGQGATARSDIYALGLVLYELYTGRSAFEAPTLAELRSQKATHTPVAPAEIARDIDPIVERVILRCLERDPRARPASVAQVAAALPGGDPLAAALAAGETPSPEMIAAAGPKEGLTPGRAWLELAGVAITMVLMVVLTERTSLYRRVPLDRPPEVLAERARQILAAAGHVAQPADSAFGFILDQDLLAYIAAHDPGGTRWERVPAESMRFWYRTRAAEPLMRSQMLSGFQGEIAVSYYDPPVGLPGDTLVWLDPQGRLLELAVVPPETLEKAGASGPTPDPDWSIVFRETGLDPASWSPTTPSTAPAFYASHRAAWTGRLPERPGDEVRLEAGMHQGRLVSVRRITPWTGPGRGLRFSILPTEGWAFMAMSLTLFSVAIFGGSVLARRHLRLGRGDRRGASRLAWAIFVMSLAAALVSDDHALHIWEAALLFSATCRALFWAATIWVLYLALEPLVRRRWPRVLVSWNRVLLGEFRDPLVGRDLLGGCLWGGVAWILFPLQPLITAWVTGTPVAPQAGVWPDMFAYPARTLVVSPLMTVIQGIYLSLATLFMLFLARAIVRKTWLGAALLAGLMGLPGLAFGAPLVGWASVALLWGLLYWILLRFGPVGFVGAMMVFVSFAPLTTDLSAWYAAGAFGAILQGFAVAVAGFVISLGSRAMFGALTLDE